MNHVSQKPIRLSKHALSYQTRRGFTEQEVVETIRSSTWQPVRDNRLEAQKDYLYNALWNRKHYATKQVRPIFVDEEQEIVVITVYTYFF